MADTDVTYSVTVKELRRRVLPELDDEFAKDLGEFDSHRRACAIAVRADLQAEAEENATRQLRGEVLKQLSERITFELPTSLVEREIDRRLEEFARQLMQQNVDPRQAGIDWAQFREAQREPARAVGGQRAGAGRHRPARGAGRQRAGDRPGNRTFRHPGGANACGTSCTVRERRGNRPPGRRAAPGEGG